jgi:4-hydroxy-4-methyl-2-oxoglutarate aldolase
MIPPLTSEQLEQIRRLDTCTVSNAIESFEIRLRNEGFTDGRIRCMFPKQPAMIGYATTVKVRCSGPPPEGHSYFDRTDWWAHILTVPAPRVVVVQDVDKHPGSGAFIGEVHANILLALKCAGTVTNGAVRDLPAVASTGFHCFAGGVSVSHSYVHIVEFGSPVEVGGLKIHPGDLVHADCHGVQTIPLEIATKIPATAAKIIEHERRLIALCRSHEFSVERLRSLIKEQV